MVLPIVISVAVTDINKIIDKTMASNIIGGVSALNYAARLNGFIKSVIIIAITTAIYPQITRMVNKDDLMGLKKVFKESVNISVILVVPATFITMLFSHEIVSLIFGRGSFTDDALIITSNALLFYSIGMLANGLKQVVNRFFYALHDTVTPMITSFISVFLNVCFNLYFYFFTSLGIGGLALATSISGITTFFIMISILNKKIRGIYLSEILKLFVKIVIISTFVLLVTMYLFNFLLSIISIELFVFSSSDIALVLSILTGMTFYIMFLFIFKIDDFTSFIKSLVRQKN